MKETKRRIWIRVAPAAAATLIFGAAAQAGGKADGTIPAEKQARLLEQFGDQGIDADGDGTLTRDEVRAFFADRRGPGPGERPGWCGRGGDGPFGKRGFGKGFHHGRKGPGGFALELLHKLEWLDPQQAPEGSIIEQRPGLDTDGDGQLSTEEWAAHVAQKRAQLLARLIRQWPGVDQDGDGQISDPELQEFKTQQEAKVRQRIVANHPEADSDGDGALSDAEFKAFRAERVAERRLRMLTRHPEADTDGDGVLSDEEVDAFRGTLPPRKFGRHGFRGGPDFKPGPVDASDALDSAEPANRADSPE